MRDVDIFNKSNLPSGVKLWYKIQMLRTPDLKPKNFQTLKCSILCRYLDFHLFTYFIPKFSINQDFEKYYFKMLRQTAQVYDSSDTFYGKKKFGRVNLHGKCLLIIIMFSSHLPQAQGEYKSGGPHCIKS